MQETIEMLNKILDEETKVLPEQSPLEFFVHHNNLHHFEDQNFEDAIEKIYFMYGKSPYMPLRYYREKYKAGEIEKSIMRDKLKDNGVLNIDEKTLDFILLKLHSFSDEAQIQFYKDENLMWDFTTMKPVPMGQDDIILWEKIAQNIPTKTFKTYPDFHTNRSVDLVSKILIPFLGTIMDQGQAESELNDYQRKSIWPTFATYLSTLLYGNRLDSIYHDLPTENSHVDALLTTIFIGKTVKEVKSMIRFELNALPGWAGMIHKMSHNKEVIPRREVYLTLKEYLLMRFILNNKLQILSQLRMIPLTSNLLIKENVFHFIRENKVYSIDEVFEIFYQLDPLKLRRCFQQAYEKSYQLKILTGLKSLKRSKIKTGKYQMFFCIDDRECSMRRYLEELSPEIETFGVAGFFGLDMVYQKVGESRGRRLCPPAASPKFLVKELGEGKKFRLARFVHFSHSSFVRSVVTGFLLAPWKTLDFKFHLYAPRAKRNLIKNLKFSKLEKIHFEKTNNQEENGMQLGFTQEELAFRVAGILKGAGLVENFATYILMIGHGHDSFNNPHVAAYRCGACSGANAYPNAKIFARVANDSMIREILARDHQIKIPENSYFIAGYHDTCNDDLQLFDIDFSSFKKKDYKELQELLYKARAFNALERSKKFYQSPKNLCPERALNFVEERAWRIAEPRPELNHATNSLCIVGRRYLTKNLFLDRKAFLVSYDATIDSESDLLLGLLSAVIPVCAGINLEYYFSKVDTENFGSGSKTSHNVVGLFGVMNGIRGDLRTGLVWQMVEYHDPLRILFIIEATEQQLEKIMSVNKQVENLIKNYWINLALIHPEDQANIKYYKNGKFESITLPELKILSFDASQRVPTDLNNPVHVAYINGGQNDQ